MKKILLAFSFAAAAFTHLRAQQDPQYSQFFLNKLNYNPAYAGTEEKICVLGMYRTQWVGFGNDTKGLTPSTFLASINAPLGQKFGIGLNISRDQEGFQSSINPILSISYRHTFQSGNMLSGGVGLGLMQRQLAGDKLIPLQQGDVKIPPGGVTGYAFDMNVGAYYIMPTLWRFTNFYAGLSANHPTQGKVSYDVNGGTVDNPMKLHYYFMTGAQYDINNSLALEPNVLIKRDPANTSVDLNVMAMYNNRFRGGLSYRTGDALIALIGFKFTPDMQIGYSYDFTTSDVIKYSSGSHEILFKYCFMPKVKEKTKPQPNPRLTPRFL